MKSATIIDAVRCVTKGWCKQRKAEERRASLESRRWSVMTRGSDRLTLKDAAEDAMPVAYAKASNNGMYPATARQVMYAARGPIQEATGEVLDDKYFTQTLLPAYMRDHLSETSTWDVVFDARGHFHEPHTEMVVPLGTLAVRKYLAGSSELAEVRGPTPCPLFRTHGPKHRFGAILFIEKEGFWPLFERVQLAERYDLGIMSTKGMSVVASRQLVDRLCGEHGIPLLVLHDFDKSGFSILGSLRRDSDRYMFQNDVDVVDLGLRLSDVEEHGLESESVKVRGTQQFRANLAANGATPAEAEFLAHGERVELNAMDAGKLVSWIEGKLAEYGIKKVIPNRDVLEAAFRRALRHQFVQRNLPDLESKAQRLAESAALPKGMTKKIQAALLSDPSRAWDAVLADLAETTIIEPGTEVGLPSKRPPDA